MTGREEGASLLDDRVMEIEAEFQECIERDGIARAIHDIAKGMARLDLENERLTKTLADYDKYVAEFTNNA